MSPPASQMNWISRNPALVMCWFTAFEPLIACVGAMMLPVGETIRLSPLAGIDMPTVVLVVITVTVMAIPLMLKFSADYALHPPSGKQGQAIPA